MGLPSQHGTLHSVHAPGRRQRRSCFKYRPELQQHVNQITFLKIFWSPVRLLYVIIGFITFQLTRPESRTKKERNTGRRT
jgi:hypothetical protein